MNESIAKGAEISKCGLYRYSLTRVWEKTKPYTVFIGLNPSTADAYQDDPTIRRCINFGRAWGCGGIVMINLFAFRATSPKNMKRAIDPIGPDNDAWLESMAASSFKYFIAAWGTHGEFNGRDKQVIKIFDGLSHMHCLKKTKAGHPGHPLYLKADIIPMRYL